MVPPLDLKDPRAFIRRLVLAEVLTPPGRPGPLARPAARVRPRRFDASRRVRRTGRR